MRSRLLSLGALAALGLLLVPGAAAAPQLLILHDTADDGMTFVGNLDRFGFALTDDGVPMFHQDVTFTIRQNGNVLHETQIPAGHDYDGVGSFAVRFFEPGSYEVEAEWNDETARFNGTVMPRPATTATLELDAPNSLQAGEPFTATYRIVTTGSDSDDEKDATEEDAESEGADAADADSNMLHHVDVLVQILDADLRELLRTQTHTHTEDQTFTYVPDRSGTLTLRLTAFQAFPTKTGAQFPAFTIEHPFEVAAPANDPLSMVPDVLGMAQRGTNAAQDNRVVEGTTGPLRLIGTFDPYDAVGTGQAIRLNSLVVDEAGNAVPHVDFEATLTNADGTIIYHSPTLHEYDGLHEFVARHATPGMYTLTITADRGEWQDMIELVYDVVAAPEAPSPTIALTSGSATDCDARTLDLVAMRGGAAFAHSEIIYTIFTDGIPSRDGKIHTHGSGAFQLDIGALPSGDHVIELENQATRSEGTPSAQKDGGGSPSFTFTVDDCTPIVPTTGPSAVEESPMRLALLLLALMGLLVAAQRRARRSL